MSVLVLWTTLFENFHCFPDLPEPGAMQPKLPPFFATMAYSRETKRKKTKKTRQRKIVVAVPTSDEDDDGNESNAD